MTHFDITQWADFVRGLGDSAETAAMQRHLDGGCQRCASISGALGQLTETSEVDAAIAPPAGALRSVKAFFSVQRPEAASSWCELTLSRVFDSRLAPAPAASRAPAGPGRQLLFESDDYTLELSVDRLPDASEAVLRGQLLEARGEPRSHTPVFLVGGGEVLDRAISERQGTFEMIGRLDRPCELWVFPDDENRIRLSLGPDN